MKQFIIRLIEAFKTFWAELSEKRFIPVATESTISDNRLLTNFNEGDPFSNTPFVMFNQPVVFEKDIVASTYRIMKIRKRKDGIRFDLENMVTGHIARRGHINKLRGVTDIEYLTIKEAK